MWLRRICAIARVRAATKHGRNGRRGLLLNLVALSTLAFAQASSGPEPGSARVSYVQLTEARRILPDAQKWEADQFPHTMSVVELKRDGFRYWGWYGLNEGLGIGLARSNDLRNWTKYESNPLWTNARWPSVLDQADRKHKSRLYFAITRDYDTPSSLIVLASSEDGIHLREQKVLVPGVPNQRNQNPNLFRDPRSGRFYLTFYRGNDRDRFEIISRSAARLEDLDHAPEKVLLESRETVAAPNLLYVEHATDQKEGVYFLATEIYPHRYTDNPEGEWQVELFAADSPDGSFQPVRGNPVMRGQRACLFQHIFSGRFYGYVCHMDSPEHWVLQEVEASPP
jgi:hypothetical protein